MHGSEGEVMNIRGVTKESLFLAFERFDYCDQHTREECIVLNKLFNIALMIECGDTPDEAYKKCKDD